MDLNPHIPKPEPPPEPEKEEEKKEEEKKEGEEKKEEQATTEKEEKKEEEKEKADEKKEGDEKKVIRPPFKAFTFPMSMNGRDFCHIRTLWEVFVQWHFSADIYVAKIINNDLHKYKYDQYKYNSDTYLKPFPFLAIKDEEKEKEKVEEKVPAVEIYFRLKLELQFVVAENTQMLTHVFFQESEDANKTSEEEKK